MLLRKEEEYRFELHHTFKGEFLSPIIMNLNDKFVNHYDDYDEVYHCNQKIHQIMALPNVTLDFHVLYKNNQCIGIALITHGQVNSEKLLDQKNLIESPQESIILNYYHIYEKGHGLGTRWLKEIIFPYYKSFGKHAMYLKSSHAKAFPFYLRMGQKIGTYKTKSDNGLFIREGQLFKISF
ncbi:hypothetical protein [Beduini massiliensis]|uniref:hypothetical protein n=1 Tax=Beduini massiliensis TaxID=1585974 RepID=UPI00059AA8D1|nr:hypothetical protein [Beduini massiliensis]